MGDEGAAVYNCLLCDSYALLILGILPDRKLARGTKGQSAYEDALEEFQIARAADKKLLLLARYGGPDSVRPGAVRGRPTTAGVPRRERQGKPRW
jgi:hypothetical protein